MKKVCSVYISGYYGWDKEFTGRIKYLKYSYGTGIQVEVKLSRLRHTMLGTKTETSVAWVHEKDIIISEYEQPEEVIVECQT